MKNYASKNVFVLFKGNQAFFIANPVTIYNFSANRSYKNNTIKNKYGIKFGEY